MPCLPRSAGVFRPDRSDVRPSGGRSRKWQHLSETTCHSHAILRRRPSAIKPRITDNSARSKAICSATACDFGNGVGCLNRHNLGFCPRLTAEIKPRRNFDTKIPRGGQSRPDPVAQVGAFRFCSERRYPPVPRINSPHPACGTGEPTNGTRDALL